MHPDLNLLVALDVLLEEESVQAAADQLHLSSPAMSRTLGRLRALTRDEILVRTGRTMTPTPYASAVRDQVHQLVQQARSVLRPHHDLDLLTLERTFSLQCHDAITSVLAPTLLAMTRAAAPGVTLRFLAEPAADNGDLRRGRVDLTLGSTTPDQPDTRHENLGQGRLVVALRAGHPLQTDQLDLARYAAADHVLVSRRGRLSDPIDTALAEHGLRRRVIASAPSTAVAIDIVRGSDAVVAVPELICRTLTTRADIRYVPLPLDLEPVPVILAWHQRHENDPAHTWLRDQVRRAAPAGP
ncbi:LysR family transcriptional regulator [uncultured Friedmanniella sp.]|uniref:LysR family transcriptional regulator n=1 Tax=uncultured Friedmanniella sp. TaxID=335381 RepID=UPI0035CBC1F3